jgi:hypothetical protein
MALPDFFTIAQGTPVIWGEAGATGISLSVTKTLTFEALAAGSARMGASADLGANWYREYLVILIIESGTAPTAGGAIDLYFACSHDNTNWPGGVTGSDGAWPADGNEDEWAKQLGVPVTSLIATNDANTVQVQNAVIWRPSGRYVAPVVDNNWDQAVRDEATATNNDSRVVLIPLQDTVQEAA